MRIFLLRHAVAESVGSKKYPKDDRPLTKKGKERFAANLHTISLLVGKPDVIICSPLSRARDTAQMLAKTLGCLRRIRVSHALSPNVSANGTLKYLLSFKTKNNIVLVGHEPQLSELAALLLQIRAPCFELKKGGICRIELQALVSPLPGVLRWLLTPKQLKSMCPSD